MTKFETLIKCRNHWQWLMITGNKSKDSYNAAPSQDFFMCFCCEYASDGYYLGRDCTLCPLNGYAWRRTDDFADTQCCDDESPYQAWKECTTEGCRKYYTAKMVQACNRAIEDLIISGNLP